MKLCKLQSKDKSLKSLVYLRKFQAMSTTLSEQELGRRESLQKLRDLGVEPYPAAAYDVNAYTKDCKNNYEEGKKVCLAGRLMSRRIMGKASFAELQDAEGRLQLYFNDLFPKTYRTIQI